jgi:hypothetical protein
MLVSDQLETERRPGGCRIRRHALRPGVGSARGLHWRLAGATAVPANKVRAHRQPARSRCTAARRRPPPSLTQRRRIPRVTRERQQLTTTANRGAAPAHA